MTYKLGKEKSIKWINVYQSLPVNVTFWHLWGRWISRQIKKMSNPRGHARGEDGNMWNWTMHRLLVDLRGHSDVKRNHSNIQEGFLSKREVWEKFKRYGWLNSTDSKSFSKIKCLCVRCSKPLEQNHSLHFRSMVAYYSNFFYFHQKPIFSTIWFPLKQCSIVNYSLTSALGKHSLNSVIFSYHW